LRVLFLKSNGEAVEVPMLWDRPATHRFLRTSMNQAPSDIVPPQPATFLMELEARQDDLLRQLDALNHQIEQAIVAGQLYVRTEPSPEAGQPAAA
jgi:hypothetical protein